MSVRGYSDGKQSVIIACSMICQGPTSELSNSKS